MSADTIIIIVSIVMTIWQKNPIWLLLLLLTFVI